MTGKYKGPDCTKRSLVYETWCETCLTREMEKVKEDGTEEDQKKEKIRRIKVYKYIGETARSAYERGREHQEALEILNNRPEYSRCTIHRLTAKMGNKEIN